MRLALSDVRFEPGLVRALRHCGNPESDDLMREKTTGWKKRRSDRVITGLAMLALSLFALVPAAGAQQEDISDYLESVRAAYDLPALAAAVVKDGFVIAAAAVGTRIHGAEMPVTINDRFHIGSNTKSMTATLAGILVESGDLKWTSTVGEVLGNEVPGLSASLADATLEQLLSHSSGIPSDNDDMLALYFNENVFDYNLPALRLETLDAWKHNEVTVPEGSPFQYANFGYMIAGSMIEKASGKPWESLMYERIFEPMGMETARLGPQATYGRIDAAVGHRILPDGSIVPMLWGPAADGPPVISPAGNASLSVLDYAKWASWNAGVGKRGPALVRPETLEYIQSIHVQTPVRDNPPPGTPTTGWYGLGWGIVGFDWADKPLLTHNGSNSMNIARLVIDTEQDLGVVVMTNFPGEGANTAVGDVMQRLYVQYVSQ